MTTISELLKRAANTIAAAHKQLSANNLKEVHSALFAGLEKYSGQDKYVHFSNINKIGINPNKSHKDPHGIYFYPLQYLLDNGVDRGQYAIDFKYAFIVDIDKNDNGFVLQDMTNDDVATIAGDNGWTAPTESDFPGSNFFKTCDKLANSKGGPSWSKLLRGIDWLEDKGESIIAGDEPAQMIVLNAKLIRVVELIDNKRDLFGAAKSVIDPIVEEFSGSKLSIKKVKNKYGTNNVEMTSTFKDFTVKFSFEDSTSASDNLRVTVTSSDGDDVTLVDMGRGQETSIAALRDILQHHDRAATVSASRTAAAPMTMFHGTASGPNNSRLRSILKHGLVPTAPKAWADDPDAKQAGRRSRASYGGTYFSSNLRTALQSGHHSRGNDKSQYPIVITATIQPRAALPDEDDYTFNVDHAYHYAVKTVDHPHTDGYYYLCLFLDGFDNSKLKEAQQRFAENIAGMLKSHGVSLEMPRLMKFTEPLFEAEVVRRVSNQPNDWYGFKQTVLGRALGFYKHDKQTPMEEDQLPESLRQPPSRDEGETKFRSALDALTKATRRLAIGLETHGEDAQQRFRHALRVMEPVTYGGRNRITSVASLPNYYSRNATERETVTVVSHFGDPSAIVKQLQEAGYEVDVVKPNQKVVSAADDYNETGMLDLLKPMGQSKSIGVEKGSTKKDGISVFKNPNGSVRYVASKDGVNVAVLQLMVLDGSATATNSYTAPEHRRTGLATQLFERAKKDYPNLVLSDDRTGDGIAWTKSLDAASNSGDLFEVKTNFPEADMWLIRKGTPDKVGSVTKTFSPEHIGIKVKDTNVILPSYLYYVLMHLHSTGLFKKQATGSTRLQNITTTMVKEALGLLSPRIVQSSISAAAFTDETGKFWGAQGAGAIFLAADTGRILLQHRSPYVNEPNTWGTIGGAIDAGEDPQEAMKREAEEETGYHGEMKVDPIFVFKSGKFQYHNFVVTVPKEFDPKDSWESQGHIWTTIDDLPKPLHFGFVSALPSLKEYLEENVKDSKVSAATTPLPAEFSSNDPGLLTLSEYFEKSNPGDKSHPNSAYDFDLKRMNSDRSIHSKGNSKNGHNSYRIDGNNKGYLVYKEDDTISTLVGVVHNGVLYCNKADVDIPQYFIPFRGSSSESLGFSSTKQVKYPSEYVRLVSDIADLNRKQYAVLLQNITVQGEHFQLRAEKTPEKDAGVSLAILNDKGEVVAEAMNEWGCTLLTVAREYRGKKLGQVIGKVWTKMNPKYESGGYTPDGRKAARLLWEDRVREFKENGWYSELVKSGKLTIDKVKEILSSLRARKPELPPPPTTEVNKGETLIYLDDLDEPVSFVVYNSKFLEDQDDKYILAHGFFRSSESVGSFLFKIDYEPEQAKLATYIALQMSKMNGEPIYIGEGYGDMLELDGLDNVEVGGDYATLNKDVLPLKNLAKKEILARKPFDKYQQVYHSLVEQADAKWNN